MLFLDEPTTGLDPRSRLGMWDIIRSLVATGTTLLLTTQYLDEADELADEIVVIDHGLVIAAGTSEELKSRVGGDVLEFSVPDRGQVPDAVTAITKVGEGEPHVDEETGTGQRRRRRPRVRCARSRACAAWTPRACTTRAWRCAGRRWTTCSSR